LYKAIQHELRGVLLAYHNQIPWFEKTRAERKFTGQQTKRPKIPVGPRNALKQPNETEPVRTMRKVNFVGVAGEPKVTEHIDRQTINNV
jgi:hypothetical protein